MKVSKNTYSLKTDWGETYQVRLYLDEYRYGGTFLGLLCYEEDGGYWEPYDDVSTFLGYNPLVDEDLIWVKDYADFLVENGLGVKLGRTAQSGFNTYELVRLTLDGVEFEEQAE